MSRQLAGAQPGATVSAQPSVIAAAPVRYVQTDAGVATPRPTPIPIPSAGPFPALVTPPPAPFYPMGPPSAFPPVLPPGTFPGPRAYLDPPPPPPGVLGPYPGIPSRPTVMVVP